MASIDSAPLVVAGVNQSGVPFKARRNICTPFNFDEDHRRRTVTVRMRVKTERTAPAVAAVVRWVYQPR